MVEGVQPTGATSTPSQTYKFACFTADKDVELTDGTKITAGQPITAEQVKQIKVTEALELTAVYGKIASSVDPTNPKTGDDTHIWYWFALLMIGGFDVIVIYLPGKKRYVGKYL